MINPYSTNFLNDQTNGQYTDTQGVEDLKKQVRDAYADRDEIARRIREENSRNSRKLIKKWDEYAAADERAARLEIQLNAMQATAYRAHATAQRLQALLEQMKQLRRAALLHYAESFTNAKLVFRLNQNTCKVGQIVGYRRYYGPNDTGWFYGVRANEITSWGIIIDLETQWSYGKISTVATVEWDAGIFTGKGNVEDLFLL